ncbi:Protein BPS1, chloroplastic [Dillenia turbinata]|uniref:Protein BPS1, chloroplastic n=1 Tax=Dillenia turbinata TaxID=194707 RepID=A0AAN8ZM45_9MAGN
MLTLLNSANDLLRFHRIQLTLPHSQQERWIHEISEASLQMLDVCGSTMEQDGFQKSHRLLQSIQKKLKKETLKCLRALKAVKNRSITSQLSPKAHKINVIVGVLREERVTTIAILESLFSIITMPSPCPKFPDSISETVLSLHGKCETTTLQTARKTLEAVVITIEDLEGELECILKRLVQTRVLLLNILTS